MTDKKKPPEQASETFQMRVKPSWLALIDAWRRKQKDLPPRAEAVRRLVAKGMEKDS